MDSLIIFAVLIGVGYFVGKSQEKKHFASLRLRESQTHQLALTNTGRLQPLPDAAGAQMVVGSVVIASDYFKTFAAGILSLFGGRLTVYESLLERGRREAILRMKEEALAWGATRVINVRLESADLGSQGSSNGLVSVEVIAYGTALK
ncbi:heavy metal-binding domain-containing protein [Pseudanabaena sp. FACHB-2040]|uniref:YbjQ family protein n=1 Tax=Pseudanabaena sp. FACHB-2040 TaxID=2692859 RepID=UPI0016875F83|nr:heavy metal-binding domain-containing protein [Pseudanabaena sp. FACHB-2040]MBD0268302.1 heavy metal-binding domain-containing protein [Cyanobacteria bacterium Co-bin8]MBD2256461.1 heavy metal-binding domain-containing protein [Pseudanabaena sp. FACHB-2040]